jgi:hypothetical protein
MNPQGADLLAQLRDIHGAPAAPWWPPAPGWWVLALLVAIGLFYVVRYASKRHQQKQRRLQLTRFVDRVTQEVDPAAAPQEYLASLNRVFKIVALRAFPENHCALMQGAEWVDFLRIKLGDAGESDELKVLAVGPYQPAPEFDAERLTGLAKRWIRQHG